MHQLILLTALTATSGLFGGGRQCGTARCGRPTLGFSACAPRQACAPQQSCAPQVYSGCQTGTSCGASFAQPVYAAPQAQYAPVAAYPSAYYPAAAGCATGNCARR